jgi:hypothetical protein
VPTPRSKFDLHRIEIRPPVPVIVERGQRQAPFRLPGNDAKRPGSNQHIRIALAENRGVRQREFLEELRHGMIGFHHQRLSPGLNRNVAVFLFQCREQGWRGARGGERFPIVECDLRAQRESPTLEVGIVLPSYGQHRLDLASRIDAHQRLCDRNRKRGSPPVSESGKLDGQRSAIARTCCSRERDAD